MAQLLRKLLVLLGYILYQRNQFAKPFPDPGSWAYNLQTFWYDLGFGLGRIFSASEEDYDGRWISERDVLDTPTYLRRIGDAGTSATDVERGRDGDCSNPPCC